jgi:hypothetical protein
LPNANAVQDPYDPAQQQNWRSIDSTVDVKDYFDNKISMRRSIEKKMHYDHMKNQPSTSQVLAVYTKKKQADKIQGQSLKMRQMAQNAKRQQIEGVNIYDNSKSR